MPTTVLYVYPSSESGSNPHGSEILTRLRIPGQESRLVVQTLQELSERDHGSVSTPRVGRWGEVEISLIGRPWGTGRWKQEFQV